MYAKALISQSTVDRIKEQLKERLPGVNPLFLVRAIARGFGWPCYEPLQDEFKRLKELGKRGRVECEFDETAFAGYLLKKGVEVEPFALGRSFFDTPVAHTTFSVVVWSESRWQARAPYVMSLPLYAGEPSNAASPESLRILNGGRSHQDFLNDLRSGRANYAEEAFKKPIPPGACPEYIEARKDLQSFREYMKEVFAQQDLAAEKFRKNYVPKIDLEGEEFVRRVISEAKSRIKTT